MVFLFSGCEVVKDLQEQAELAAKALGDTGYDYICDRNTKAIDSSKPGDVNDSQYLGQFDPNIKDIITYSLIFTDEQATVQDDNGNNVTVTMSHLRCL